MLFATTFIEFISKVNVICGMISSAIGLAVIIMANRLSQLVEEKKITRHRSSYVFCMVIGVILLIAGMVVIALPMNR